MECIACHSRHVKKNGFYKSYQSYKCKDCERQFSKRSFSFFFRCRFPEEVIQVAILLYFFVSTRNVAFLVREMRIAKFSHQSVYNWSKKFAMLVKKHKKKASYGNIWHVDEKFIKARNRKDKHGNVMFSYLWVILDYLNRIIATHVSHERDIVSATEALMKAVSRAEKPPDIIVSDGLPAYIKACKKVFGRKTKHVTRHFKSEAVVCGGEIIYLSNNRLESFNSKINLWYKKHRGFKKLDTADMWCESFAYFCNHRGPSVIPQQVEYLQKTSISC